MQTTDPDLDIDTDQADERPSKSARKRAAHAAQVFGERLIALREADLVKLELPEPLLAAVREARGIRARGGLARQKQYTDQILSTPTPRRLGRRL
ncbi:MAG: DUF615 domain-containing protein, partial [Gammaproteobacteria bacterium]